VVAVTVADPTAIAVTSPEELTATVFSSDDDHVNVLPEIVVPITSWALALSCNVAPIDSSVAPLGVTTTETTVGGGCMPVGSSPQAESAILERMETATKRADAVLRIASPLQRKGDPVGI
jgi:hypothetical protein